MAERALSDSERYINEYEQWRRSKAASMEPEHDYIGTKKTALVFVIVIGCFAVLWPRIFYPMMVGGPAGQPIKPNEQDGGECSLPLAL